MIWPLLYAALWKLAPPLIGHYLRRRARKQPEYLQHWDERWARGKPRADDAHGAIWVHAVSVGETRAAAPLVAALRARWPDKPLLITQMTPTGRETDPGHTTWSPAWSYPDTSAGGLTRRGKE